MTGYARRQVGVPTGVLTTLGIVRTLAPPGWALVTVGVANWCVFARVVEGGTISKIRAHVGAQSGNIAVAAYKNTGTGLAAAPGTLIASSGSTACPAVGSADVSLGGSFAVSAGDWLAVAADNTTVTFAGTNGAATSAVSAGRFGVAASSFPPPGTVSGFSASNGRLIELIGVP
jgi:hypothetical protein